MYNFNLFDWVDLYVGIEFMLVDEFGELGIGDVVYVCVIKGCDLKVMFFEVLLL